MSNWRELPPGREFDTLIAEALGFTVERNIVPHAYGSYGMYKRNEGDVYLGVVTLPHYSTNTDEALALPLDRHCLVYLAKLPDGKHIARIVDSSRLYGIENVAWKEESKVAAHAICRAWLAWKEVQTQEKQT